MKKNRHIKTTEEKYGKRGDKCQEFYDYRDSIKGDRLWFDAKDIFDECPYLGIFYLPMDGRTINSLNVRLGGDWEKADVVSDIYGEMKKCKIIGIGFYIEFIYYDDHHDHIAYGEVREDEALFEGNVLRV